MAGPRVLVFDVNETLSDMAPLGDRFADVGALPHLAGTWFAGMLRDGFALTVHGVNPSFADGTHSSWKDVTVKKSVSNWLKTPNVVASVRCGPKIS